MSRHSESTLVLALACALMFTLTVLQAEAQVKINRLKITTINRTLSGFCNSNLKTTWYQIESVKEKGKWESNKRSRRNREQNYRIQLSHSYCYVRLHTIIIWLKLCHFHNWLTAVTLHQIYDYYAKCTLKQCARDRLCNRKSVLHSNCSTNNQLMPIVHHSKDCCKWKSIVTSSISQLQYVHIYT